MRFVHFKARNGYIWSLSRLESGDGFGVFTFAYTLPEYIAASDNRSLSRSARIAASQLRSSQKPSRVHYLHVNSTFGFFSNRGHRFILRALHRQIELP